MSAASCADTGGAALDAMVERPVWRGQKPRALVSCRRLIMPAESGDPSEKLWSLVLDLSAQVAANQKLVELLKKQLEDLQGQAIHSFQNGLCAAPL